MKRKVLLALLALSSTALYAEWKYGQSEDQMTNKVTRNAVIESKSFSLPSPYSGLTYGYLHVGQHPKHGLHVSLQVTQGAIVCIPYNCPIEIRFDSAQPIRFNGINSGDFDPTVVFIDNPQRFIQAASKANKILVQVSIFQAGSPVLEFHNWNPLEWGKKKKK